MRMFENIPDLAPAASLLLGETLPACGLLLVVYALVVFVHTRWWLPELLHPVLISAGLLATALTVTGVPFSTFMEATAPIHQLLPLMFALQAVPLWRNWDVLQENRRTIVLAAMCGASIGVTSAHAALAMSDLSMPFDALAIRGVPTPAAISFIETVGGPVALTALLVLASAICASSLGMLVFRCVGVVDERAQGLTLGVAGNALGVARAFQISPIAGAFSTVGMILNTVITIGLLMASNMLGDQFDAMPRL